MSNIPWDLEERIMECWHVTDDLKILYEECLDSPEPMEEDELSNILLGLEALYNRKFARLFQTYEAACKHGGVFLDKDVVDGLTMLSDNRSDNVSDDISDEQRQFPLDFNINTRDTSEVPLSKNLWTDDFGDDALVDKLLGVRATVPATSKFASHSNKSTISDKELTLDELLADDTPYHPQNSGYSGLAG